LRSRAGPSGRDPRSVLGPQPAGERRTTAGKSGHRTFARSAGRSTYSPLTSYGGEGRRGVQVSPPAGASPPGSCPRDGRYRRMDLTLWPTWSRRRQVGSIVVLAGRATPGATSSGYERSPAVTHGPSERAVDLTWGAAPQAHHSSNASGGRPGARPRPRKLRRTTENAGVSTAILGQSFPSRRRGQAGRGGDCLGW